MQINEMDNDRMIILTYEGKTSLMNLINQFSLKDVNEVKNDYLIEEGPIDLEIPPFLGFFIADKVGKTIAIGESYDGALESFLGKKNEDPNSFDIQLIPMFFSALESFATEINLSDLSNFKLKGNVLTTHIFMIDIFTISFFINQNTNMKPFKERIQKFFEDLSKRNRVELERAVRTGDLSNLSHISVEANKWLEDLNRSYRDMLVNRNVFDEKRAKKVYSSLDELALKLDKKYSSLLDDIKNLRMKLMRAILEENLKVVKEISQKIKDFELKYL